VTDRGKHQSIHTALIDDPQFQKLTPEAKLCFYTLKLMLGAAGIDVVRAHQLAIAEVTGLGIEAVRTALRDLDNAGFLMIEENVLWLRNGLRFNPALNLDNSNHRKSIKTHLEGLPALAIVNLFAEKYDFGTVFDTIVDTITDTITDTIADQETEKETRKKKQKKKKEKTFSKENEESKLSYGSLMKLVREVAHLNPRDKEGREKIKRSGDVLNKWIKAGLSLEEIASVIINTRNMVDNGEISWIKPGSAFSLLAIKSPSWIDGSSQPLYNAALDHGQKETDVSQKQNLSRITVDIKGMESDG
jgi:hypothetical protein